MLAVLTMFQPVVSTTGSIFLATNKARLLFLLGALNALIMVLGIVVGLRYGIVGVAIGYTASYLCVVLPLTMYSVVRVINEKIGNLFLISRKPAFITILFIIYFVVKQYLFSFDKQFLELIFSSFFCGLLWISFMYFGFKQAFIGAKV